MSEGSLRRFDQTNRRLLETLETPDPSCTPQNFAEVLKRNKEKLMKTLGYYRPPSTQSANKLKTGKVEWRGRQYNVDEKQQKFVLQLSKLLQLDEIQAFGIFQNYLRTEVRGQKFAYDETTLDSIMEFYFEERISLLNCLSSILRNGIDDNYLYAEQIQKFLADALKNNLDSEIIKLYIKSCEIQIPKDLTRQEEERWANQLVSEQVALLEVLFLIYYVHVVCTPQRQLELLQLFKEQGFGTRQLNYSLLNNFGYTMVKRIGYISILILTETMNLEKYLDNELDNTTQEFIKSPVLQAIDKEFQRWGTIPQHGPPLLAWAALTCRINQIKETDEFKYKHFALKAMELNAIPFLVTMLREGFSLDDPNLTGYKSVLKGLLSILLTAFDVECLPNLVEFHQEIFSDQPSLCHQFWEHDYSSETLRALLDLARHRFPHEFEPLIFILLSLAGDGPCAHVVFRYLADQTTFRHTLPPQFFNNIEDSPFSTPNEQLVRVKMPFTVDKIIFPADTVGKLVGYHDDLPIIEWKLNYSAWSLFMSVLDSLLERLSTNSLLNEEQISRCRIVLQLIDQLLSKDSALAQQLRQHLKQCYFSVSVKPFAPEQSSDDDIIPRLFLLFRLYAFQNNPDLNILSLCMKCLKDFAKADPGSVWLHLNRAGLLGSQKNDVMTGAIRHLLNNVECVKGSYSVTIPFLDLLAVSLSFMQQWHRPHFDITSQDFHPYLVYICTDLFNAYESWKYTQLLDRWQIAIKILHIFNEILRDKDHSAKDQNKNEFSLRNSLLHSILYDASFHNNLLNIVGIGYNVLEQLLNRRKLKEGQTLEKLIVIGFTVLEHVLLLKEDKGLTSLELSILNRKIGKNNDDLIFIIASYIYYSYSYQLPLLATRVLTRLCGVTLNVKSRPPSLVGYLSNRIDDLRAMYLWKLGDPREHIDLRIAILRFISTTLDTQPGLAELFVNLSLEQDQSTSGLHEGSVNVTTQSVIDIILLMLEDYNVLLAKQPRLLSEALSFLCVLWRVAPDHYRIVTFLRGRKNFWTTLLKPLFFSPYDESSSQTENNINTMQTQDENLVNIADQSYRIIVRAYIFKILALELFFVPIGGEIDPDLASTFKKFREEKILSSWIAWFVQSSYNPDTKKKLLEKVEKMNINIESCVVLEPYRVYGHSYFYDTFLLQKKFGVLFEMNEYSLDHNSAIAFNTHATDSTYLDQVTDILKWTIKVNEELSLVDAQQIALHAWRSFCEVAMLRQPRHLITEGRTLLEAIHTMGVRLAKERREGLPIFLKDKEICRALLFFTRKVTLDIAKEYLRTEFLEAQQLKDDNETDVKERQTIQPSQRGKYDEILIRFLEDFTGSLRHVIDSVSFSEEMTLSLLTSILMLVKTIKNWDSLHLSTIIESILSTLLECIENKLLMNVSLNILEVITRNFANSTLLLSHLRNKITIAKLLETLNFCLQNQTNENTAEAILLLFLTFSQNYLLAESLAIDGLMSVACNESFAYFCRTELYPYTAKGERNTWHRVWCLLLSVVANTLRSLGNAEKFVDQVLEFVSVYQMRIVKTLDFIKLQPSNIAKHLQNVPSQPLSSFDTTSKLQEKIDNLTIVESNKIAKKGSTTLTSSSGSSPTTPVSFSLTSLPVVSELSSVLTIATLEETERITVLLYELSRKNSQQMFVIEPHILEYQQIIVKNIQYITLLLLYPPKIIQSAMPISSAERKAHKKPSEVQKGSEKQQPQSQAQQSPVVPSQPKQGLPSVSFIERIEQILYVILRNSIGFVETLLPTTFSEEFRLINNMSGSFTPLFAPSLEVSLAETPSLGILLNCANICALNLKKLSTQDARTNPEKMILLLLYIVENSLHIVLLHIIFYLSSDPSEVIHRRVGDECGNELESVLGRMNKDLNKILSKTRLTPSQKEKKIQYFRNFETYVHQLIKSLQT